MTLRNISLHANTAEVSVLSSLPSLDTILPWCDFMRSKCICLRVLKNPSVCCTAVFLSADFKTAKKEKISLYFNKLISLHWEQNRS